MAVTKAYKTALADVNAGGEITISLASLSGDFSSISANDVLLGWCAADGTFYGGGTGTIADDGTGSPTKLGTATTPGNLCSMLVGKVLIGDETTVTFGEMAGNVSDMQCGVTILRGVDVSGGLSGAITDETGIVQVNASSGSVTTPAITPGITDYLLVYFGAAERKTAITEPSGMTALWDVNNSAGASNYFMDVSCATLVVSGGATSGVTKSGSLSGVAINAAGLVAIPITSNSPTISVPAATISLAAYMTGASVRVSPPNVELSLAALAPTITGGQTQHVISVPTAELTLAAPVPTVDSGGPFNEITRGSLTLTPIIRT